MIDVIILQHNQSEHTCRCLRSLKLYSTPDTRVILVDNGSDECDRENAIAELKGLNSEVIVNDENLGFIKGTNQGLRVSTADYVVLQNNDTELFDDSYARMAAMLKSNEKCAAIGPVSSPCGSWVSIDRLARMWPELGRLAPRLDAMSHSRRAQMLRKWFPMHSRTADTMIPFFCTMFKKSALDDVGLLDETYGVGLGDDDDYCLRLRRAGYEIRVALGCYVFHNHRTTFKALYTDDEIKTMQRTNIEKFLASRNGK